MKVPRITIQADQMRGAPCIRGLRIPVSVVVHMVADGMSTDEILELYPDLEREDIAETLRFTAEAVAPPLKAISWEELRKGEGVVELGGDAVQDCNALYDDP